MKLKLKTSKSAMKRFKVSGKGRLLHRKPKQNHFNAKEAGQTGQQKKKQKALAKNNYKDIDNLMPYI